MPSSGRITTLDDKSWDKPVKSSIVVVAIEAELEKVPTGEGTLGGPELEFKIARGRVQEHFRTEGNNE